MILHSTIFDLDVSALPPEGEKIEVAGNLIVAGDKAIIIINGNKLHKLEIEDAQFFNRLISNVPCFVGGRYLYDDCVKLTATVKIDKRGLFIASVQSGTIYRKDEGTYNL